MSERIRILEESREFIVVHKPSGLSVYRDSDRDPEACQDVLSAQLGGRKLFPVHRLDKSTCGVLVYGFSPTVAHKLTELFRSRAVSKRYVAVVHGIPQRTGLINTPLAKNKEKTTQPAETLYQTTQSKKLMLEGEERSYALVRLDPKTGRYHQLRRHLRGAGHPIVGDPEYGNTWDNRVFAKEYNIHRTLLSAVELKFTNPFTKKAVTYSTKPDADFLSLVKTWGWKIS